MSFEHAVAFVLLAANDGQPYHVTPGDPGGATAYGWALRENPDLSDADLRAMTPVTAAARYRAKFWPTIRGDDLPDYLQLPVLDCAVAQGPGTAIKVLQRALYVTVDGAFGPSTLAAVTHADPHTTLAAYASERIAAYAADADWPQFHRDWTRRAVLAALEAL